MLSSTTPDPTSPLTPSELVLLNGEKFAEKVLIGNIKLLHSDASVSVAQLGEAILKAAFLANDRLAAFRLEVAQKKALLGLRKVDSLFANPSTQTVTWPAESLEAAMLSLARRFAKDKDDNEVSNLIYAWLREDSASPWQMVIEKVQFGLAERGLLYKSEEKKLKIFTVTHYSLPDSTALLAKQQPGDLVKQLFSDCESYHPEVWKLLTKHIKKAIDARTERTDTDFE